MSRSRLAETHTCRPAPSALAAAAGAADAASVGVPDFRPVKSAVRTLDVLEALAESPRPFLALSAQLSIPKSSLHGILRTLTQRGWVEQGAGGMLQLGLHAVQVGSAYLEADATVTRTAPLLDRLAAATGETVQLARLDGADVVYLAKRDSIHPVRLISTVGSRLPAHATSLGKALLAGRDDEQVRACLTFPLPALTGNTITSWKGLAAELRATRARSYAADREEAAEGLCCFGIAPAHQQPVDAISISVPAYRLSKRRAQELIGALLEVRQSWTGRSAAATPDPGV